jgi:geranylgeranyl diphosphate synthase type I
MGFDSTDYLSHTFLLAIEDELHQAVLCSNIYGTSMLHHMLAYHMGWVGKGSGPEARGKRIRPLLVLLSCAAAGGDWQQALPAAAAVELVHNFSLIHDDIEDHSPLRRGRPTVWKKWGIPQAINAGDAMFTLAQLEALRLADTVSPAAAITAWKILQQTCLHLTQGQYLDLTYESRTDLTIENYWHMVEGKTAALISTCTELGAIAASRNEETRLHYRQFGRNLGLAFQVQDDRLGIWGDSAMTGKSNESDLVTRKKTLPVLYGLIRDDEFAAQWKNGSILPDQVRVLANLLEYEGGKEYTQTQVNTLTKASLDALEIAQPQGLAGEALKKLALELINRQG